MTAAAYGSTLLDNVKIGNLNEILNAARHDVFPIHPSLGIDAIDHLLEIFERHANCITANDSPQIDQRSIKIKTRRPRVLEITAAVPCSGKTQLLYYMIAVAILPKTCSIYPKDLRKDGTDGDVHIAGQAGQEGVVVLFDLDGQFDVCRLAAIMGTIVRNTINPQEVADAEQIVNATVRNALDHLHVYQPTSTFSLIDSLDTLTDHLFGEPNGHLSANRRLRIIAIQNLSTYLAQDRWASENEARSEHREGRSAESSLLTKYRQLVERLRYLANLFSCSIVATNATTSSPSFKFGQPALPSHLPAIWNNFVTLPLVAERESVRKFAPGMSVQEAERERAMRWQAVQSSAFLVWINWAGADGWTEAARKEISSLAHQSCLKFRIDQEGVHIRPTTTSED